MAEHRSRNVGILIALQLAYLAWLLMFGRFMGGDEIAYKVPGREWHVAAHSSLPN